LRKKFTEGDLESALRLLAVSAQRFASSGRLRQAVAAKLEAGDVYLMMSRYQQVLAAYRQALTMSKDRVDQQCAALSRIARTYANFGHQPRAALRYADQGVSVCMTISDKKALADAFDRGETHFWSRNFTDATASLAGAELASQAGITKERLATMMLKQIGRPQGS
jgi:tetratricopeptide (TPR) repeat protein